jgi:hypothetical protein
MAFLGYLSQHSFVVEAMDTSQLDAQYSAFSTYWVTSTGSAFPAPLPPGMR